MVLDEATDDSGHGKDHDDHADAEGIAWSSRRIEAPDTRAVFGSALTPSMVGVVEDALVGAGHQGDAAAGDAGHQFGGTDETAAYGVSTTEPAFSGVGSNAAGALGWRLSLVGLSVTANIVASRRLDVCSGGWSELGCQDIDRTL